MDILLEGQDCPLSCKLGPILIFTGVSTQTRGAHDTVAGNEQRQRVPTHGLTNRATGFGGTGQLCQLAVRSGFSPRNLSTSPAYPAVEIFTSWQPWFQVDPQSSAPPPNGQHQIWVEAVVLESLNWGGGLPTHINVLMSPEHHGPEWGGDFPNSDFWRSGVHRFTLKSTTSGRWSLASRRKECGSQDGSTSLVSNTTAMVGFN